MLRRIAKIFVVSCALKQNSKQKNTFYLKMKFFLLTRFIALLESFGSILFPDEFNFGWGFLEAKSVPVFYLGTLNDG